MTDDDYFWYKYGLFIHREPQKDYEMELVLGFSCILFVVGVVGFFILWVMCSG